MRTLLARITVMTSALALGGMEANAARPTDTAPTRLALAIGPQATEHPGKSGIYALPDPGDAFAARVTLAAAADRTLDVQYYIWHDDETGTFLLEALWRAANRGVRVRLLLDDSGTSGLDEIVATLDAHPNVEVRLYNPLFHRWFKPIELRHGLPAREPAHAQQVVHRGRPGIDCRRAKRRQRVLRGGQRHRDSRTCDVVADRSRGSATCPRPSTGTGTARPPTRQPGS